MKRRWISLYVENQIGVLARIAGLFSSKSYNIDTLTVGETEDRTVSRMTISLTSDDQTFEQIKKQLNRSVEVIKVIDFTEVPIMMKEMMFVKIRTNSEMEKQELFRLTQVYQVKISDYNMTQVILESQQEEAENNHLLEILSHNFAGRLEVVRGGNVAIEALRN